MPTCRGIRPARTPAAFYLPDGDNFLSTAATTSPWDANQQHGGPASALLARAVETCETESGMAVSRISINFLNALPHGRMTVTCEVLQLGRGTELVEARLAANGRRIAVARGWRHHFERDSAPTSPATSPAATDPSTTQPQRYIDRIGPPVSYRQAVERRLATGDHQDAGPDTVWARPRIPLIAAEEPTGLQRVLIVTDLTAGIRAGLDLLTWTVIPPTLTVTLDREPSDEWLRIDAPTPLDPRGPGITRATLADRHGPFGVATQPRPPHQSEL